MAVELPLFPLGTVLFPHMRLPLHIFEERYRRMVQDCETAGGGFGVVAIREGHEVGAGAVPFNVGTLARVREREPLTDGRSNLMVVGASRFRVRHFVTTHPYLVGSVEYLEDSQDPPAILSALADQLRVRVRAYAGSRAVRGYTREALELSDDPELLAYLVAASLRVDVPHRQRLLELDSAAERLRACIAVLRHEESLMKHLLVAGDRAPSNSLN